jgi:hypothetical protein
MAAFKAQAMSRELRQRLEAALSGLSIIESQDSGAMPILKIVKGSETVFVKTEVDGNPSGGVDGLDLSQRQYSPHRMTILRDGDTISDQEMREKITAECARAGCKVLLYEINPLPSAYDLTGATLKATLKSNQWHPLTLSE